MNVGSLSRLPQCRVDPVDRLAKRPLITPRAIAAKHLSSPFMGRNNIALIDRDTSTVMLKVN